MSRAKSHPLFKSFNIDDELTLQSTGAVEVTVEMANGEKRWCFFITPQGLAACGDWIEGTRIRIHYGAPHMIVVAAPIDAEIIEKALRHIERAGDLYKSTIPLETATDTFSENRVQDDTTT